MSKIAAAMIERGEAPPDKGSPEWDDLVARIEKERGMRVCAAIKRGRRDNDRADKGFPCENAVVRNTRRCRFHGGRTPKGADSVHFKHGRYAKVIRKSSPLSEAYQRALNDPTLLSLNDEIAVMVAKLEQVMARIQAGESNAGWSAVHHSLEAIEQAIEREDADAAVKHLRSAIAVAEGGLGEEAAWAEYIRYTNQLRKLIASETRHRAMMRLTITPERLHIFQLQLQEAARRVLPPDQAAALADELRRLRGEPAQLSAS